MKGLALSLLLLAGMLASASNGAAAQALPSAIVILRVNVIDGTGAPVQPDRAVVLAQGRIAAVGSPDRIAIPHGARIVDAAGGYLIPGLWDLHVHVLRRGREQSYFPLLVAQGVTGVRDMGGDYRFDTLRRWRAQIASGALIAPQFVAAGPFVDGPYPALPSLSRVVADAAQARATVRELQRAGADFIKVYNRVPRDAYFALADEAQRAGIAFAGHVPFSVSAREAARSGQTSIEHLFNVAFACSSREGELMQAKAEALAADESATRRRLLRAYLLGVLDSFDAQRCQALFQTFVRHRTWQVPTLVQRRAFSGIAMPQVPADQLAFVPRSQRAAWLATQDARLQTRDAVDRDIERRNWERDRALIAPMNATGVRLLAGTDAGDPYAVPGFSLHEELAALVEAGLSPMKALQSATRNAAEFLDRAGEFGTIRPGLRADLVLLRANPLSDIRNTRQIEAVAIGGRWLARTDLDALLRQARAAVDAQ